MAVAGRGHKLALALAGRDLLIQVKMGEVLAYDLAGFIALDSFGSHIPRRDNSLGIQNEYRVIPDGLDKKTEHRLGLKCLAAPRGRFVCEDGQDALGVFDAS